MLFAMREYGTTWQSKRESKYIRLPRKNPKSMIGHLVKENTYAGAVQITYE
jgi:hypothetical protein